MTAQPACVGIVATPENRRTCHDQSSLSYCGHAPRRRSSVAHVGSAEKNEPLTRERAAGKGVLARRRAPSMTGTRSVLRIEGSEPPTSRQEPIGPPRARMLET
jgi:hypothetical protein